MGGLSWWHWLIIIAAFILLFGAKKLPDAARGVGRSLRILKSEVGAMQDDDNSRKSADAQRAETPQLSAPQPVQPATVQPVTAQPVAQSQQPVQPVPVQQPVAESVPQVAQPVQAAQPYQAPAGTEQFSDPTRASS